MTENNDITLPASGLAEDILARYMDAAQQTADRGVESAETGAGETVHHLVTFHVGKEEYGVAIENVQEILRGADITPVPGAHSHVRGVINLRGKIIPVVDMRKRFALSDAAADGDAQRIIVLELGVKRLGMLVDRVSQVIKVPAAVVEVLPEEATTLDANFIKGIGKLENRLILILDLNRSLFYTLT